MLVYDTEIAKAILGKNEQPIIGIQYCGGWRDFANMGIAVLCAYEVETQRYRTFFDDNLSEFAALVEQHQVIASFNGDEFDNQLLAANGIVIPQEKSYDLLVEVWKAAGLGPKFQYPSHMGYGLDALCKANFGTGKTGHGALAPVQFQRGEYGAVVDYCLADVWNTWRAIQKVIDTGVLICPKTGGVLRVARPLLGPAVNVSSTEEA